MRRRIDETDREREEARELARLVEARNRWRASGIRDYVWTVHRGGGFRADTAVVAVEDGVVREVEYHSLHPDVEDYFFLSFDGSVNGFFAMIEAHIHGDNSTVRAEYTEYHARLGYPEQVFIDRFLNAIDDEIHYWILSFEER